jgi:hypothetical protein
MLCLHVSQAEPARHAARASRPRSAPAALTVPASKFDLNGTHVDVPKDLEPLFRPVKASHSVAAARLQHPSLQSASRPAGHASWHALRIASTCAAALAALTRPLIWLLLMRWLDVTRCCTGGAVRADQPPGVPAADPLPCN